MQFRFQSNCAHRILSLDVLVCFTCTCNSGVVCVLASLLRHETPERVLAHGNDVAATNVAKYYTVFNKKSVYVGTLTIHFKTNIDYGSMVILKHSQRILK